MSMLSNYNGIKLELNDRKDLGKVRCVVIKQHTFK